jgi:PAS domain-containing protein
MMLHSSVLPLFYRWDFIITARPTLRAAMLVLAASLSAPVVLSSPSTLKIGVGRIVPVAYFDENGTAVGFAVDVINEAARREHISVSWVRIKKSFKEDLQSGRIDLLSAGMATEERKQMFYVSEPWWSEELALLSRAGTKQPVRRLGIQQVYFEFARPHFDPATFILDHNPKTDSADIETMAVCKGSLDGALITHGELHDLFLNRPEDCNGVRLESADTAITYGLSVISRKSDEVVAKRLRKRIDDLILDGKHLQFATAHPPISISGAVHLSERLRERYHKRMWVTAALICVLLIAILLWFLWNRQRTLIRISELHHDLENAHIRLKLKHRVARMGAYEWFVEQGRIEWSSEMEAIYGQRIHTLDEWKTHVHPKDLEPLLTAVDLAVQNRQTNLDTTFRIIRPGGEVLWIHSRGEYEYDATGQPVHILGVNMDITDLKRGEMAQEILDGLLHVCSACRRIHDGGTDEWYSMEGYLRLHTTAKFSHGMCPDCGKQWFSEASNGINGNGPNGSNSNSASGKNVRQIS